MTDRDQYNQRLDASKQRFFAAMNNGVRKWSRPNGSACHRCCSSFDAPNSDDFLQYLKRSQPFVIEHDWAAAFASATDFAKGEVRLPYDECCFEFRLNGLRLCAFCSTSNDDKIMLLCAEIGNDVWLIVHSGWAGGEFEELVWQQIRAVLIVLDSEIATTEIIRAPYKLNRKREKLGRLPLRDYHVVKLNRARPAPLPEHEASDRRSVRCHFRRGHWRHFATFKTWIKWTLVGDPDLGFIDKHYRL